MKAAYREEYLDFKDIQIKEIPAPICGDDEILVKVHASSVNRTGCALVNAKPFIMRFFIGFLKPKRKVLGTDLSGEVVAIGKNVTRFKLGDRVMASNDEGLSSHAEFAAIDVNKAIVKIPSNMDYVEAAACLEAPHYAYSWIKNKELKPEHTVLINGATGGIGTAMMQLAKNHGCKITAVGNGKNLQLLKELGADKVYNYEEEDFTQCDLKYDFVLDAVGKSTYGKCKKLLKADGVYLSSELGPYWQNPFLAMFTSKSKGKRVEFPLPSNIQASLDYIADLIASGKYKPVIERVYPLDEIASAYEYVSKGLKTGNIVLMH